MLKRSEQSEAVVETPEDVLADFVSGYSIEVTPRTAAKIEDFRALLPAGTRVYVAHIEGTPIGDMVATARRLRHEGFSVMPHIPARGIDSVATLESWLARYRDEADVDEALLLAGGMARPSGDLTSSMDMMETGLLERFGFRRLHVAGHPEGHRDIDAGGTTTNLDNALAWKQAFAQRTGVEMALVTQFLFDAKPLIAWTERIAGQGVTLPVHVGVAGPAKLQTLVKYAISCGVGPSLKVLQRRAMDISRLMLPHEPWALLSEIADYRGAHPESLIEQVHFFPLGGIRACAEAPVLAQLKAANPARP